MSTGTGVGVALDKFEDDLAKVEELAVFEDCRLATGLLCMVLLVGGKVVEATERELLPVENVFWSTGLKKGKERLPQPGILTSQPVEMSNKSINIAEKIERLLNVSRNFSFPESVLVEF